MSNAASLVSSLPFPAHTGVRPAEDDWVALPDDPSLTNHVGTVHAGALFTIGECASGVAVMRDLAEIFAGSMVVAKNATIAFRKPARGVVKAHATLVEERAAVLARLGCDGKVVFDVAVVIEDQAGVEVATMTVSWYALKS